MVRNHIGPKRLHGCMHIWTVNTDSCIVYFLVCWCKGYATRYSMCAVFNSLCNVKCCKIVVVTSCTKLYIISYLRSYIWGLTQKSTIYYIVGQLQKWYCIEAHCYDMQSSEVIMSIHVYSRHTKLRVVRWRTRRTITLLFFDGAMNISCDADYIKAPLTSLKYLLVKCEAGVLSKLLVLTQM